jgi:YjbE family integral membrane protein
MHCARSIVMRNGFDRITSMFFARRAGEHGRMPITPEFWSALAAIVVIDLVLAGDNAIVIALAARNLPRTLQRRAVLWGTLGAVVVRASLTVAVLWLLQVPGLMAAGGALLVWIAYRLLSGDDGRREHDLAPAMGFWAAMRTIVVADAVMGLDNVLAVAGAAHGSVLLVVLGLLISIPVVVWGSTLILHWLERFPSLLYVGGAVLAWTAAKMIADEPLVADWLAARPALKTLLFAVVIGGVLGGAKLRSRRATPQKDRKEALQ